ncbi:GTPase [Psychroflexus sp. CAK57W]|uniref:GTPase n=1 Tax=Psychroflexus curvus TaxID=2873595 RepID=UPI001CCCAE1D|nr:GTPase [Psychroflexus curvus]MBZ9627958.1 GTPase [Psychroflexus curvus]MBZ9787656.1 GTPase [Psychroflexus curvus]
MQKNKALIFVYNANSGVHNSLLDSVHKILSPKTYECNLCELTFGAISENRKWKAFRKKSDIEMVFLHKKEYQRKFKSKFEKLYDLPVILYQDNYDLSLLMGKDELNQIEKVETLIEKIKSRI